MTQLKIFTLKEVIEALYGKKGTKKRDQFDKIMRQERRKTLKKK